MWQVQALLREWDKNRDGELQMSEFKQAVNDLTARSAIAALPLPSQHTRPRSRPFAPDCSKLNCNVLCARLQARSPLATNHAIERLFGAIDIDGSGKPSHSSLAQLLYTAILHSAFH